MSQILLRTYLHEKLFIFCRKFQFNGASWIFISCIWQLGSKLSWKPDLRKRKSNKPLACVACWVFFRVLSTVFPLGFFLMHGRNRAGTFALISHARESQAQATEWRAHSKAQHCVHARARHLRHAQTTPDLLPTLKDSVLVGVLRIFF